MHWFLLNKLFGTANMWTNVADLGCLCKYWATFVNVIDWSLLIILCRNGRYQLQSSRNIISPSTLSDSEEVLNQGTQSAAEVLMHLRSKCILHLFASIGKFLGLEVSILYYVLILLWHMWRIFVQRNLNLCQLLYYNYNKFVFTKW